MNTEDYLKAQNYEDKVNEHYQGIQDTLVVLDKRVNDIVHQHEKDFLSAFRTLMGQVQGELQMLRQLSDEQALVVKRDHAVQSLQDSLN